MGSSSVAGGSRPAAPPDSPPPPTDPSGVLFKRPRSFNSASWQLLEDPFDSDTTDGGGLFAEEAFSQTVWGSRYIDDAVLRRTDTDQDYNYADTGERTDYYLTDPQFSVVAVVDRTGALQERVAYSAYGEARHHYPADMDGDGDTDSGDMSWFSGINNFNKDIDEAGYNPDGDLNRDGSVDTDDLPIAAGWSGSAALAKGLVSDPDGPGSPIGYDGYLFNAETKLYTVRLRHYEPLLGRWVERDAGFIDSESLYEYGQSSPVVRADAYGLLSYDYLELEWGNNLQAAGASALWSRYSVERSWVEMFTDDAPCNMCAKGREDLEHLSDKMGRLFGSQIANGCITGASNANGVTFISGGGWWSFTVGKSVEGYFTLVIEKSIKSAPDLGKNLADDLLPGVLGAAPGALWAFIQYQDGDSMGAASTVCETAGSLAMGTAVGLQFGGPAGFAAGVGYSLGFAAGTYGASLIADMVESKSYNKANESHCQYLSNMWDLHLNAYMMERESTNNACEKCCKDCN